MRHQHATDMTQTLIRAAVAMATQMRFLRLALLVAVFAGAGAVPALARPVGLAWDANSESNIAGYVVRWGTQSRTYTNAMDVHNTTSATITLGDTTTYYIAVEAYNTANLHSSPSSEVIVKAPKGALAIDTPKNNAFVTAPFNVTGWAIDSGALFGTGVDVVQVWAYPNPGSGAPAVFVGAGAYGTARSDVATAFGSQFSASGFSVTVTNLAPAPYQINVFGHSTITGTFSMTSIKVRVAKGPILQVDTPMDNATVWPNFTVAGWAVDLRAGAGTGMDQVNVYAKNVTTGGASVLLGAATYGGSRPTSAAPLAAASRRLHTDSRRASRRALTT